MSSLFTLEAPVNWTIVWLTSAANAMSSRYSNKDFLFFKTSTSALVTGTNNLLNCLDIPSCSSLLYKSP